MNFFNDDFVGNIVVMIIGLVILGVGAQVFIAGAYVSTFNYYLTIVLMTAGAILIGFALKLLFDLVEHIKPGMRRRN